MTNQSVGQKKTAKKGTQAKQAGALLMGLGILLAVIFGSFGALPAILFFGGLITLIVGIARRDGDNT